MSDNYHNLAAGNSRGSTNGGTAPTRPRKRIYDAEVSPEEEILARRPGHYAVYHETVKGIAPYKKGERMARYTRRPDTVIPALSLSSTAGMFSYIYIHISFADNYYFYRFCIF